MIQATNTPTAARIYKYIDISGSGLRVSRESCVRFSPFRCLFSLSGWILSPSRLPLDLHHHADFFEFLQRPGNFRLEQIAILSTASTLLAQHREITSGFRHSITCGSKIVHEQRQGLQGGVFFRGLTRSILKYQTLYSRRSFRVTYESI